MLQIDGIISLAQYLARSDNKTTKSIHIHTLGQGRKPTELADYSRYSIHRVKDMIDFQRLVYDTCDAILCLVTKDSQPNYFDDKQKLFGSIVQAVAYKRPLVIHEDLARRLS